MTTPSLTRCLAVAAAAVAGAGMQQAQGQVPSFALVQPAPGSTSTRIYGMSADGVAAGYSISPPPVTNPNPGFIWSASQGRYDFGLEPGLSTWTLGFGISGDGRTVVGEAFPVAGHSQAFRWQAGSGGGVGTYQTLGTLGLFPSSKANAASGDGSIVVGTSSDRLLAGQAFRWTQATGMQSLPLGPNSIYNEAKGISRDGGTIVGYSADSGGFTSALVWTNGGVQVLPQLPGTSAPLSQALGVNYDGSVIVGLSSDIQEPVVWRSGVISSLGLYNGMYGGSALVTNNDGSVIGGYVRFPTASTSAFVWTPTTGMQLLSEYLAANGVTVPTGWSLVECNGLSADGLTMCGYALGPGGTRGFVATIPAPGGVAVLLTAIHIYVGRRRRPTQ